MKYRGKNNELIQLFGDNLILLLKVQYLFCIITLFSNKRVLSNKIIIWFISCWLSNTVFSMNKTHDPPNFELIYTICFIISVQNYYIEYQCWHRLKYLHYLVTIFYSPVRMHVFRRWKIWDFYWRNISEIVTGVNHKNSNPIEYNYVMTQGNSSWKTLFSM